jgi:glycosyltransferase involved in cell wall biosynthesis
MTTYDHEKFIAQAIESVLTQNTNFPYELVIGEDCSTDGTREIVCRYAARYPEVIRTLLPEHNIGAHENFRQVFYASRGQYLAILEGDDYWTSSEKLQIQADVLDAHPETSICCHRCLKHYEDNSQPDLACPAPPAALEGVFQIDGILDHRLGVVTGSVMFRRVIDCIPKWSDELIMGDIPLLVTLAGHGDIRLLREIMSVYRIHSGGTWSGMDELAQMRASQQMLLLFERHLDPKYLPVIRKALFKHSYDIGTASFSAGKSDDCRQCLWDCVKLSGIFSLLPQKLLLALKGYCGWVFPARRRLRRMWRQR